MSTPGPWIFKRELHRGDVDHIATVAWVGDYRVGRDCGTHSMCNYEHHDTNEADARLIAAAPDLLNALRSARTILVSEGYWTEGPVIKLFDAAIDKATGEQQ